MRLWFRLIFFCAWHGGVVWEKNSKPKKSLLHHSNYSKLFVDLKINIKDKINLKESIYLFFFPLAKLYLPGFSLVIADHVRKITYNVTNDDCNKPDVE